ncbi:MAG: dTDP-glucose 4,6-dehydratase [Bdellovibrio sp. CG10_big_fil_rev_8_21_14_0_10_47_8]|nr:MAG: dTDP-glucose 4,6-dehydratase [Bdellovibrio sp. CG10_big_fil_rev_8_21_14_0_10_47_8]
MSHLLVTGGAGFIGSSFVELAVQRGYQVTILDSLTYAGHRENFEALLQPQVCEFVQADIQDRRRLESLWQENNFSGVVHFAAESHVDNSIRGPEAFLKTNVIGTFELLESVRAQWPKWDSKRKEQFRFVHVSTDEVFGSLGAVGKFSEQTRYAPNSPYSASKAASDHLARAWFHTFGLPTIITNCSNNYGPRQFPEKLIPRMITQALRDEKLPVYGAGANIRDWIHVRDHCQGVLLALTKGAPGSEYCFGGNSERSNLDVVKNICALLDELRPRPDGRSHQEGIEFVQDRAGHDFRYAIDDTKAQKELGFSREYGSFEAGLRMTVEWYLENAAWIEQVTAKN